jgi:pimeloyl-ACP methyl ester carboxylesterase
MSKAHPRRARSLKPPNAFLVAMEGRAPWEFGMAFAAWPWLTQVPRGDGHGVVVFPGLAASDGSTVPLRAFLRGRGYDARGWRLKRNFGPRAGVLEQSLEEVREVHRATGRRVSLIGWSLGGIYAREIAKLAPEEVRCVITLATPFTGSPKATNVWRFYEMMSGHSLEDPRLLAQVREPPPVPTTSIFSRTDGVVAWQCCVEKPSRRVENIEVPASHFGIGLNPAAWFAVADRLCQSEGDWRPFHREGWRRWVYADPYRLG